MDYYFTYFLWDFSLFWVKCNKIVDDILYNIKTNIFGGRKKTCMEALKPYTQSHKGASR